MEGRAGARIAHAGAIGGIEINSIVHISRIRNAANNRSRSPIVPHGGAGVPPVVFAKCGANANRRRDAGATKLVLSLLRMSTRQRMVLSNKTKYLRLHGSRSRHI
jgi:hypothetical protein